MRATTPRAWRIERLHVKAAGPAVGVPHAGESAAPGLSPPYSPVRGAVHWRPRPRVRTMDGCGRYIPWGV